VPSDETEGSSDAQVRCPACGREVHLVQRHAGFGNQGFMYCDRSATVLTWDGYDPAWIALVGETHPWMLTEGQRRLVEAVVPPCSCGGSFRFANPPRCPHCQAAAPQFSPGGTYYVVTGEQVDATRSWLVQPGS
jgi:hypothetical protein